MALTQVCEFVGKNGGNFMFGLGVTKQAMVYTDDAARCGKRVQRRVVNQDQVEPAVGELAVRRQAVDQVLKIVLQYRVVQRRRARPD